jgi:hypothetical protein
LEDGTVRTISREFDTSPGDALRRIRTTVEEQRRIRRMSRNSALPPDLRSDMVDALIVPAQLTKVEPEFENNTNPDRDAPDEWGRQSFPASDPPQNW